MVYKRTDGIRVAKIHPQFHAGIFEGSAIVVRNIDGIAEKRLVHTPPFMVDQHEVQLMDVECVQLVRTVLDDPIFNRSLSRDDIRQA